MYQYSIHTVGYTNVKAAGQAKYILGFNPRTTN